MAKHTRRGFLAWLGFGGAAVAVPSALVAVDERKTLDEVYVAHRPSECVSMLPAHLQDLPDPCCRDHDGLVAGIRVENVSRS